MTLFPQPASRLLPYDILRWENLAIPMAYFSVGVVGSLLSTPLNVYLVRQLNAEPTMQNTIGILQTLPWSMKLLFGFLSDTVPIGKLHRKPYLALGSLLYSLAFMGYAVMGRHDVMLLAVCVFLGTIGLIMMDVMADTMCVQRSKFEPEAIKGQMQSSCYSIRFAGGLLGAVVGASLCNRDSWGWGLDYLTISFLNGLVPFVLVTPTLFTLTEKFKRVAIADSAASVELGQVKSSSPLLSGNEKSHCHADAASHEEHHHHHHHNGHKIIIAEERTHLIPNHHTTASGYQSISHIEILSPASGAALISRTSEATDSPHESREEEDGDDNDDHDYLYVAAEAGEDGEAASVSEQLQEIWRTVQLRSVWRPMAFVYIFNLFQVPNVAWQSYLQLSLHFPAWVLGATVILGSFMTFAGVLAYKRFFFKSSWRSIYVWTVLLTAFFSFLQLLLIFQLNTKYLHLNNYLFSLGDDVISSYISGIQFLPLCIMYMRLCPDGAEGASYAMLTTFGNIALVCSSNVGNLLARIWDVSNDAMRRQDVSGLWKLNLLTSTLAICPLALLFLLPRNAEEQEALAKSQQRSPAAGAVFLLVLFGSLTWTSVTAIWRVMEA